MSSSVPCAPSNRMRWPPRIASAEHQRDIANPRAQALAVHEQLIEHGAPVHGAVLDQAVPGHHVVADVLLEALRVHRDRTTRMPRRAILSS